MGGVQFARESWVCLIMVSPLSVVSGQTGLKGLCTCTQVVFWLHATAVESRAKVRVNI